MEIYILRHGIAEEHSTKKPDALRELTEEGREKLRQVLRRAAKARVKPSLIISSPLVRAVETAQIAAEVLGCEDRLEQMDALKPEASPAAVWQEIRMRRDEESILLAGHEPQLSSLTAYLLGAPGMMVDMKKGALVRIDVDAAGREPHGVLMWMLTPRLAG